MSTAKQKILKIVELQPDNSSYEDIVRELTFGLMIERGLKDINEGRVISFEELKCRVKQW